MKLTSVPDVSYINNLLKARKVYIYYILTKSSPFEQKQTREKEKVISKEIKTRYERQSQKVWSETYQKLEQKWRQEHKAKLDHFKHVYQQLLLAQGEAQKRAALEAKESQVQSAVLLQKLKNQISVEEERFEVGLAEARE